MKDWQQSTASTGATSSCRADRQGDCFVLETAGIRRVYRWNGGNLLHVELADPSTGRSWPSPEPAASFELPGEAEATGDGELVTRWIDETSVKPRHLLVTVASRMGTLEIRREFELYVNVPAIRCTYFLRGRPAASHWRASAISEGALRNIEALHHGEPGDAAAPVLDRLTFPPAHLHAKAVQFFDISDRRNNLVAERELLPYRWPTPMRGNLLLLRDELRDTGLFFLKESPCSDVQLADPAYDFTVRRDRAEVVGLGADPADLDPGDWLRCYGVVVGVGPADETDLLRALRAYQATLRRLLPERDEMIVLNTWGDRGQDRRIGEAFALREIEGAARLGVSHFQLDDGWQKGRSTNSAQPGGFLQSIWERDPAFWEVDPAKFPRGLAPIAARAKELGVEVCLWYNPSRDDGYLHWERDADQILALHRRHGVRVFKIDGIDIPNKQSEVNLRRMFDKVQHESGGAIVFNLDVTAQRRFGYHTFTEYGNLFIENRYTDWGNYYPHWTLRNLWQLSRYVPPQRLQVEFLNKWRNPGQYPADDPLAPRHVLFDYCFAIAMMAQPLAWFECANLPEEAYAIAPLVQIYRRHMAGIHAGQVFPIGDEPSGRRWTGFQSAGDHDGYLLVFRELNPSDRAELQLPRAATAFERIAGQGAAGPGPDLDTATIHLPQPFTFGLFRYQQTH